MRCHIKFVFVFPLFLLRECAVKFNDYFEFPRDIDMEPFTEVGLAKLQGQLLETANSLLLCVEVKRNGVWFVDKRVWGL